MDFPYEIYLITAPGYWYVGSASGKSSASKRFRQHLTGVKSGARMLSLKIKELGSDAFRQTVVERGVGDPIQAEQNWYDFYLSHDARQTLNGRRPGKWDGFMLGREITPEHRAKLSAAAKLRPGIPHTPEAKAKMSAFQKGRPKSPEHAAAVGRSHRGKVVSLETRRNMSLALQGKIPAQNFLRYKCAECDLITAPGPLGRHQKAIEHSGRVPLL